MSWYCSKDFQNLKVVAFQVWKVWLMPVRPCLDSVANMLEESCQVTEVQ